MTLIEAFLPLFFLSFLLFIISDLGVVILGLHLSSVIQVFSLKLTKIDMSFVFVCSQIASVAAQNSNFLHLRSFMRVEPAVCSFSRCIRFTLEFNACLLSLTLMMTSRIGFLYIRMCVNGLLDLTAMCGFEFSL